jgi:hypothetical protein
MKDCPMSKFRGQRSKEEEPEYIKLEALLTFENFIN